MMPVDLQEAIEKSDIDTVEAYYLYSVDYHGGQSSDEYKWLSFILNSGYKPSRDLTIENASEIVKNKYNEICYREGNVL